MPSSQLAASACDVGNFDIGGGGDAGGVRCNAPVWISSSLGSNSMWFKPFESSPARPLDVDSMFMQLTLVGFITRCDDEHLIEIIEVAAGYSIGGVFGAGLALWLFFDIFGDLEIDFVMKFEFEL